MIILSPHMRSPLLCIVLAVIIRVSHPHRLLPTSVLLPHGVVLQGILPSNSSERNGNDRRPIKDRFPLHHQFLAMQNGNTSITPTRQSTREHRKHMVILAARVNIQRVCLGVH